MSRSLVKDVGAFLQSAFADFVSVTAGGGGDGAESDGVWVSRDTFGSAKLVITFEAVLGDGETLSIAANAQDADDNGGTNAADFGDAAANAVVATGGAGGSTERGTVELDFDLEGANAFLRSQVTPTMSAATTDTVEVTSTWVFGGAESPPVSNRAN